MARRYSSKGSSHRRSNNYGSSRNDGYERARQHIEDAQRLSRELGGTDHDVKQYFFSLPVHDLDAIFSEYGKRFGSQPEEYARETFARWKSGRVTMSGTVAERLFKLLPPRMPITEKFKLTESLWNHFGPSSKKRLRIGLSSDINSAIITVEQHITDVVISHQIPNQLEARFSWLSDGDVGVKQQLLNHLRALESKLASDAARLQLPVMIDHLKSDKGTLTHHMVQTLTIGKHQLELFIDRDFEGVALEDWKPPSQATKSVENGTNWIFWILVIGGIVYWLSR
jgi:hypothetical protein